MTHRAVTTNLFRSIIIISLFVTSAFQTGAAPAAAVTLNITVNAAENRKPISPYIYGLNFAKESFADEIDLPVRRWGGNATSRYNWQNGNLNTANDWYFENAAQTNAYAWDLPEDHNDWVEQNIRTGTASLITIPMLGYVAKNDFSCGFSIAKYGGQTDADTQWRPDCGNGINAGGYISGNDPLDTSIAVDETFMQDWVTDLVNTHGTAANGGVRFYALDNEPELWSETHRDAHPAHQTYDELLEKGIAYGEAVKAADPGAKLLGYVAFGWSGYWYSWSDLEWAADHNYAEFPDYESHGNMYQVEWYLDQMRQYEQGNGVRLLDYLDLHYYPESGVALQPAGNSNKQALRLRSTRSLWDPAYRDESWIGGSDQDVSMRYVKLIPRMRDWAGAYYPGTKLAITEYNFGGLEHINGALAQADALGIFGREGLDFAALWNYPLPGNDPLGYDNFETLPGAYAFRMYRNYDGNGGRFGDVSVSASSADQAQLSVYAAQRTPDSALTLIVINKTAATIGSSISLANFTPAGIAQVYRYDPSNLNAIVRKADISVSSSDFSASFPANSITLLVLPDQSQVTMGLQTFKSTASHDGWILESTETSNTGGTLNKGASILNLGDDPANRQYRAILSFNTGGLPDNATVTKVTLKVKRQGVTGGGNPVSAFQGFFVDIKKGSFGTSALALGDFKATANKTVGPFSPSPASGWYTINLTKGKAQVNTTGLTQIRLRFKLDDNNNSTANILKLYSGNAGAANRPQLIVEYFTP